MQATLSFTTSLTKAMIRDLRALAMGAATPAFMLLMFWLLDDGETVVDGLSFTAFLFPTIVSFSVILAGGTLAQEIINWRQQGVFMRLGATPANKTHLLVGMGLAHLLVSLVQSALMLALGVAVIGLPLDVAGTAAAFVVLLFAGSTFLAFGGLISSLVKEASISFTVYFFILLPMFFIGGGFMPASAFPGVLGDIGTATPVALVINLIRPLFLEGTAPPDALLSVAGLIGYTVVFTAIAAWAFKWEA